MKILVIGNKERYGKFAPDLAVVNNAALVFCDRGGSEDVLLQAGREADVIFADAISPVTAKLIGQMPNLKMIHSEGVGYDKIDLKAAAERGIYVCNNKGCNAGAVAEQAILLMLALLRNEIVGDAAVRDGRQIEMKEQAMLHGITELGDCKVGLIGLGDIGKATAERLLPFGCELYYYSLHRKTPAVETQYGVQYRPLEDLASLCDILSIHAAVTPQTIGMINGAFLARMKKTAYLVNTARGEIIDAAALRQALIRGTIAGAGLDTLYPEPTTKENPLVDLPAEIKDKVVLSPHLGGITTGSFRRAHLHMWQNIENLLQGEKPTSIVNGL